ncbi:hypothetical protein J4526_05055 [Desulfurococcaceae archaeon MEX13E-LK6-19]|nr:hypothetical protein J4526_05055 [Desulfurococcaceae archaeon MEX13E-LK6-19]
MSTNVIDVPKVEIKLTLGFNEESEKALRTAWKIAQKILEEYGVWVEVIPIHVWYQDPLGLEVPDLPIIEVNGRVMSIGKAPSEEELEDVILSRIYAKGKQSTDLFALASIQRNNPVFENGAWVET